MADRNILLIGDSIRLGYCQYVKEQLQEKFEVVYPQDNCRNTQYVLYKLNEWKSLCVPEKVEAVYFNCGHWDIAHFDGDRESLTSLSEYKRNIEQIIRRIKLVYSNAELIFATTTAIEPALPMGVNCRTNSEIEEYNKAAVDVCSKSGIAINDLYALSKTFKKELHIDFCHFTPEGYKLLADSTVKALEDAVLRRS